LFGSTAGQATDLTRLGRDLAVLVLLVGGGVRVHDAIDLVARLVGLLVGDELGAGAYGCGRPRFVDLLTVR